MHPFIPDSERHFVAIAPEEIPAEELLAWLSSIPCRVRADLSGGSNRDGGSGGGLGSFLELGHEFLKTTRHRRYTTPELGLECEWDDEMLRRRLGIYPPGRVWFLAQGADSAFWACSLTPKVAILRDAFNEAPPSAPTRNAWEQYIEAFRMTFTLASSEDVLLDCNPNNFGISDGRLYYVDDDLAKGCGRMPFGHQALLRLREYADSPLVDRVDFLSSFARLADEFAKNEMLRNGLLEDFQQPVAWPDEPELRTILDGLVASLGPPTKRF